MNKLKLKLLATMICCLCGSYGASYTPVPQGTAIEIAPGQMLMNTPNAGGGTVGYRLVRSPEEEIEVQGEVPCFYIIGDLPTDLITNVIRYMGPSTIEEGSVIDHTTGQPVAMVFKLHCYMTQTEAHLNGISTREVKIVDNNGTPLIMTAVTNNIRTCVTGRSQTELCLLHPAGHPITEIFAQLPNGELVPLKITQLPNTCFVVGAKVEECFMVSCINCCVCMYACYLGLTGNL